jgi:hypothetical protein
VVAGILYRQNGRSGAQEREYGEYAAVITGILWQVQLGEDAADVGLDGLAADVQLRRQGAVGTTLSHKAKHGALSLGALGERVTFALRR